MFGQKTQDQISGSGWWNFSYIFRLQITVGDYSNFLHQVNTFLANKTAQNSVLCLIQSNNLVLSMFHTNNNCHQGESMPQMYCISIFEYVYHCNTEFKFQKTFRNSYLPSPRL